MGILIDTHVLIWFLEGSESLKPEKRSIIVDSENEVFVSVASLWEMAIKLSRGKLKLTQSLASIAQRMRSENIDILNSISLTLSKSQPYPSTTKILSIESSLPRSLVEELSIITFDRHFSEYGVELL